MEMIEINNLTEIPVDEDFLKKATDKVLKEERKENSRISIVFVSSERVKRLNKTYRNKNEATDVLSFSSEDSGKEKFLSLEKVEKDLGEIIICPEEVRESAKKNNVSFKRELVWVLIHGILHLLGYTHEESKKEAEKMRKKEDYYLSQLK